MNKKLGLIVLGLILLFSMLPYTALALNGGSSGDEKGIGGVFETIYDFFNWIPKYITLDKLMAGNERAVFIARLLIWIMVFSMTYFGLKFINSKGARGAVSFVIGVMGSVLIPEKILLNIFQTYSIIAAVVIWAVPMIFGYLMISKISKEHSFIRAFIYLLIFVVLFNINDSMSELVGSYNMESMFGYFKLLYIPVIFGFFSNLTRGATGGKHGTGFEKSSWFNWGRGRTPTTPGSQDLDREEATDIQIDNYITRLQGIENQLTAQRANLDSEEYRTGEQRVQLVQRITSLQQEFNNIKTQLTQMGVIS